jgi:DNA-directed RNA polymerase subunit beta
MTTSMPEAKSQERIHINPTAAEHFSLPNLMEVQLESYREFLQADALPGERERKGLEEAFLDVFPIRDYTGNIILEFIEYTLGLSGGKDSNVPGQMVRKDSVLADVLRQEEGVAFVEFGDYVYRIRYSPSECMRRDLTYAIPLNMRVRLINRLSGEVKEQDLFVANLPLMTDSGTFIINGAERVIVSQLHRSPGVYFDYSSKIYNAKIVPYRGAWVEYELDALKDLIYVRLDRKRKIPVTVFLRALGYETDEQVLELFDNAEAIQKTLKIDKTTNGLEALDAIYKKLRPGEPFIEENARQLVHGLFFNPARYDLGAVGRYKLNQKLSLADRIIGQNSIETVIDEETGELLAEVGKRIRPSAGMRIEHLGLMSVRIKTVDEIDLIVRKDRSTFTADVLSLEEDRRLELIGYQLALPICDPKTGEELIAVGKRIDDLVLYTIQDRKVPEITLLKGRVLDPTDILGVIRYLVDLSFGVGNVDDIDHLGNRRVRRCGELLQNQFRLSLARMERVIRERMTIQDINSLTPQVLINTRPIVGVIDEFFGSSQLSQFMDQVNPLSELTHKRRLSALGPGGLRRERAGYEVRDVHPTHFGRLCPIETPEGPNAGLISSLTMCARMDEYGFLISPFKEVVDGRPVGNAHYLDANQEEKYTVSPYDARIYRRETQDISEVACKTLVGGMQEFTIRNLETVDGIHVSPLQMVSVATGLIPFLEHDDANRALMGTNMQRQAVPLIMPERPIVGTGVEGHAAKDSGATMVCRYPGVVLSVDSAEIVVERTQGIDDVRTAGPGQFQHCVGYHLLEDAVEEKSGKVFLKQGAEVTFESLNNELRGFQGTIRVRRRILDRYPLVKFTRTNQCTCINQRPCVEAGQQVEAGEVIGDGPSTQDGELALGKNVLVAFMPFQGYNFEDAIVLSERMVRDDIFTSIHVNVYETEARDTKLGAEEITKDIPNVGEDILGNLDEEGVIRIGAEVSPGDVLVGKITPKGETELTAEDKLLRAIFGEKAREVRNTSLTVPHGEKGKVVDVMVFSRETGDELSYGVNKLVRVFVAQRRQIMEGDKMAGRHGNKGVVARIVPREDMPRLENGRVIDIVLNPLGVPSRMNLGQVLETHLGWAGHKLNRIYATDLYNRGQGVSNEDFVRAELREAELPEDGKTTVYDGITGKPIDHPVMVGEIYMLKLAHLVDDKIHARATGPYSLVTQQPLGGKAQFGGQRFGEMEVWALEAYGAAHTLRELLTIKSDDVEGRVTVYETIIKGDNEMQPSVPESFKVVVSELQSLGLKVDLHFED